MFSVSMLLCGLYAHRGPLVVIAGFLVNPILDMALPDVWGPIVGNAVLGSGWIVPGYELLVDKRSEGAS